ncbi:MAG: molybdenum cofactor biosynthesis protein MoaE [Xanthomonadales bacterium]|nr:molybdenum cofactor biosynthesis protein MoaE [Xanthomonadales bacterium]NIN59431.1 molybdenum cofactor biosynthesis protein MoaE [Xanthomonadales bacterium]NIN74782.1 molybdenum cofactor biosynthesis protein MoaE [Xanthomonadales bacterium]NIO14020.1 molybdenum cofactor biosynthesis protein MoaE [Xanthomonadales bacterium]NIP11824.1 molybdenum cofactor biosynthesis protein MoaE [Xanthomonadales bacterium]
MSFSITDGPIDAGALRALVQDPHCGACVVFEGWVRNHNEGREVLGLEYEVYEPLAVSEGLRILAEARHRFGLSGVACVHRTGRLGLGEVAVVVVAAAAHRDEAFRACRYVIDEVKRRLPIWKKEHYRDGEARWVNCRHCVAADSEGLAAS